jgi:DNA-nicking Smr family endonuclease
MKKDKDKQGEKMSAADAALWSFVTQDVTPLKRCDAQSEEKPSESAPHEELGAVHENIRTEKQRVKKMQSVPKTQDVLIERDVQHDLHSHGDIDRRSFDKFRKGQMPIEATLDLHGYNQQQAYDQLCRFITRNAALGLRCVMVITGKGRKGADGSYQEVGILKQSLPQWLEQPDLKSKILKLRQAQRFHGGSGAYYILLKRQK